MDAAVITAIFAGAIGVLGAFFGFVKWIVGTLTKSLDKNTLAMNSVAKATTKSAKEAAQRNGHLAELAIENKEATLVAIAAIQNPTIKEQHVEHQTVEASKVKKQTGGK